MKHFDILTIGNGTWDIFLQDIDFRVSSSGAVTLPLGGKIDIDTVVFATGGGATNAAATFANFGFRTAYLGTVGNDENGQSVITDLKNRGIDTSLVRFHPTLPTSLSVILSIPGHGRTVLTHRSSGHSLTRRQLPLNSVGTRWLYCSSFSGDRALLGWILRTAKKQGVFTVCNPGAPELAHSKQLRTILRNATVVLLNLEEANQLAGTRGLSLGNVVRRLRRSLNGIVVVTDGPKGAVAAAGEWLYSCGAHLLKNVVEWTGAGDAFGSGFVSGLIRSRGDVVQALQYGTANAEGVITEIGAKNGLLRRPPTKTERIQVRRARL